MRNIKNTIIVTLTVLCIYLWGTNKYNQYISESNTEALTDSISYFQTKEGVWVAEKELFQGTERDLKQIIKSKDKAFQK